ncbi:hypothetical protein NQ317_006352 [Molorchus minor]|uniref:Bardet-Biedl syndrome 4 n=1 Tax=Molorchus minor TaxID=1323400 RepID=A0ABQ9JPJ0_9CUCU|nr:hypothetical protein NQ317_006352 [Molorchus minor]
MATCVTIDAIKLPASSRAPAVFFKLCLVGVILRQQGKFQEAIETFQKCLKLVPNQADRLKEVAKCFLRSLKEWKHRWNRIPDSSSKTNLWDTVNLHNPLAGQIPEARASITHSTQRSHARAKSRNRRPVTEVYEPINDIAETTTDIASPLIERTLTTFLQKMGVFRQKVNQISQPRRRSRSGSRSRSNSIRERYLISVGILRFCLKICSFESRHEGRLAPPLTARPGHGPHGPRGKYASADDIYRTSTSSLYEMHRFKLSLEACLEAERVAESPHWEIYYYLGQNLLKLKNMDKAKEYAQKAVEELKHEMCYTLLIKILVAKGDFKSAVAVSNAAVESCPDSVHMLTESGLLYLKIGQSQHAFERLSSALALEPTHTKALLGIGYITQKHQEYDVALSKYKIAVHYNPESVALWNNIGMCFYSKHKYVAGFVEVSPVNWRTLFNLGLAHLATSQPASAFNFICAAVGFRSDVADCIAVLGCALMELNDPENATKAFRQALVLTPDDPELLVNAAVCSHNAGYPKEASDFLKRLRDMLENGTACTDEYEKCYSEFKDWCDKQNVKTMSENILLAYLMQQSKVVKSSTLWSIYSMLKCLLNIREGIDVRKFLKLVPFLERKAVGYQAKKLKVFTREQIDSFIKEANDNKYLMLKVMELADRLSSVLKIRDPLEAEISAQSGQGIGEISSTDNENDKDETVGPYEQSTTDEVTKQHLEPDEV